MKNFTRLLVFVLLISAGMLNAQSLKILTLEDVDVSGTEQTYTGPVTANFNTIAEHFKIANTSGSAIEVKVKKIYINVVEGTFNDFCWAGSCLPATTLVSPGSTNIPSGGEQEDFDIHYHCQGIEGTSRIMYVAFDKNNPDDSVSFTVNYVVGNSSVTDVFGKTVIGDIYPNPAGSQASIDYNLPSGSSLDIVVYDMLGKEVMSFELESSGILRMPLGDLERGTYFCRYLLDDKLVETQKLIVK